MKNQEKIRRRLYHYTPLRGRRYLSRTQRCNDQNKNDNLDEARFSPSFEDPLEIEEIENQIIAKLEKNPEMEYTLEQLFEFFNDGNKLFIKWGIKALTKLHSIVWRNANQGNFTWKLCVRSIADGTILGYYETFDQIKYPSEIIDVSVVFRSLASQQKSIKEIAKSKLGINSLESRGNDNLDFYELAVWDIKSALNEAYMAGYKEKSRAEK
jgi:hypothetical protein